MLNSYAGEIKVRFQPTEGSKTKDVAADEYPNIELERSSIVLVNPKGSRKRNNTSRISSSRKFWLL